MLTFLLIELSLLVGIATLIYIWLRYRQDYWRRRNIPHNKPDLLRGNWKEWQKTKHISVLFKEIYDQYKGSGPFAGFDFLFNHFAVISDRNVVKNILIKDFHNFHSRGIYFNEKDDPLTGNLFFMDGEKWKLMRHKMSPTFTSGKMKYMFNTVVQVGEELNNVLSEKLQDHASADTGSGAITMEVLDLLARYTADIIGICAFGLECNSLRNPTAEFVEKGRLFFNEKRHSPFVEAFIYGCQDLARKLGMRIIHQEVHDFYMKIVEDTVKYREEHQIKRNDFMDMLIEMKNSADGGSGVSGLTIEEIAAQAFVFFVAGFETSSTTMGSVLYELACHQDIQEKLRKHLDEVFNKHNNEFTYECMKDMDYLEQVIDETLRLHPVIGHLIRKTEERYETSEKDPRFYLEAKQLLIIPVLAMHYDAEFYPEPHEFRPERFTDEEVKKRPACSYLPFGDGPRNCIGLRFGKMQSTIGLAFLIRNFKFDLSPETEQPPPLNLKSFIMNYDHGIKLKVQKIQKI